MKNALLLALASLLLAPPARTQETSPEAKAERSWRLTFAYDHFLRSKIGNGLKDQMNKQAGALLASGYKNASYSSDISGGTGARLGVMQRVDKRADLGLSLGYIIGPVMNATLSASGGPGPGGSVVSRNLLFIRYLAEGNLLFPLTERTNFMVGAGVGMATGRVKQTCESTGTVACPVRDSRRTWTGFSWEVTPSFSYRVKGADFRLGARYAGFPTFQGNDQIARIEWMTFGLFAGVQF